MLALLCLTAVSAWAQTETLTTTASWTSAEITGEHIKVNGQYGTGQGLFIGSSNNYTVTIAALNGETITKVEMTLGNVANFDGASILSNSGEVSGTYAADATVTLNGASASEITLSANSSGYVQVKAVTIHYTAPAGTVTPVTGKTNQWTLNMPAGNVELQVEYDPWKVTLLTNNDQWGTVEAVLPCVEWNADTWADTDSWKYGVNTHTVDGVTVSYTGSANISNYQGNLYMGMRNITFSADKPFKRIEMTQTKATDNIQLTPKDNWSLSDDKTILTWEGEPTQTIVCQTCTLTVSKIKFFLEGGDVTANRDGTYSVVPGKSITLKATPAEGYRLAGWYKVDGNDVAALTEADGAVADDEAGTLTLTPEADMTIRAEFAEQTYTVTLNDKTFETNAHVTATVASAAATITDGKIEGVTKGQTVILKANTGYKFRKVEAKEGGAEPELLTTITASENSSFKSGSQTFDGVATVTLTGDFLKNDGDHGGWHSLSSGATATVNVAPANGVTITSVKFYTAGGQSAEDTEAPFEVTTTTVTSSNITTSLDGNSIGNYGVNKIEVYGYK